MLFNSFSFAFFFIITTSIYFSISHRYRNSLLIISGCLFYISFIPKYILILFATIAIDYNIAIHINKSKDKTRKILLACSVISLVLVLSIFKYSNFLIGDINALAKSIGWNHSIQSLSIILPIGLSFHTFQSLSYVIEVYRGNQKPETDFWTYFLYVMFYPQLVAGPIERPMNLLHQFHEKHEFDYDRVTSGLKRMGLGLFKKVVIADRLAPLVDDAFTNPDLHRGIPLILATIFFAFQIYYDFSGYSDIALGSAQVLGFRLMENFNRPYASRSVVEFWKRWHISLSTWFRDYLYIPLGGSKRGPQRFILNIMITFFLSGLWHGANNTYIVWGILNGILIILYRFTGPIRHQIATVTGLDHREKLCNSMSVVITFCTISITWVFFRADGVPEALRIIQLMITGFFHLQPKSVFPNTGNGLFGIYIINTILLIAGMEFAHWLQEHKNILPKIKSFPIWVRFSIYYGCILLFIALGAFQTKSFIYFQF